jgi:hypothetical protein
MVSAIAVLMALVMVGCAAKKKWYGDPESGLNLEYRFSEKKILTYRVTNDFSQTMDIMGQKMEITSDGGLTFSVMAKGSKDGAHLIGVTIDSMSMEIGTPRGAIEPDMSTVMGKSFDMTLSLIGKELNLSGAGDIKYDMGQGGERNVITEFQVVFPNTAGKPVTVGDSWTVQDTVIDKSANGEMEILFESVNTVTGFETVNDMECVVIETEFKGRLSGTGTEGGLELVTEGEIEGNGKWHFAYKQGIFVKEITEGAGEGVITGTGPQEITIPMTREFKVVAELIKR